MISSRQIVEVIEDEIVMSDNQDVNVAFKKLIKRIEVLEDIEMGKMFKDFMDDEEDQKRKAKESRVRAEQEFNRVFKENTYQQRG